MKHVAMVLSILAGLLLGVTSCNQEGRSPGAGERASTPLVGAWRSSLQFQSGDFAELKNLEFMYVFNAGGTTTESSNYDGAPPFLLRMGFGINWRLEPLN